MLSQCWHVAGSGSHKAHVVEWTRQWTQNSKAHFLLLVMCKSGQTSLAELHVFTQHLWASSGT